MSRPRKLSRDEEKRAARLYFLEKVPIKAIAVTFCVSYWTIRRVLLKKDKVLQK